MRVFSGEVVSVFAHVQTAEKHRSSGCETLNQDRVARGRRPIAIDLRSCPRRKPTDVEQIFYGEFDGGRKKRVLVKIIGE